MDWAATRRAAEAIGARAQPRRDRLQPSARQHSASRLAHPAAGNLRSRAHGGRKLTEPTLAVLDTMVALYGHRPTWQPWTACTAILGRLCGYGRNRGSGHGCEACDDDGCGRCMQHARRAVHWHLMALRRAGILVLDGYDAETGACRWRWGVKPRLRALRRRPARARPVTVPRTVRVCATCAATVTYDPRTGRPNGQCAHCWRERWHGWRPCSNRRGVSHRPRVNAINARSVRSVVLEIRHPDAEAPKIERVRGSSGIRSP